DAGRAVDFQLCLPDFGFLGEYIVRERCLLLGQEATNPLKGAGIVRIVQIDRNARQSSRGIPAMQVDQLGKLAFAREAVISPEIDDHDVSAKGLDAFKHVRIANRGQSDGRVRLWRGAGPANMSHRGDGEQPGQQGQANPSHGLVPGSSRTEIEVTPRMLAGKARSRKARFTREGLLDEMVSQ